MIPVAALPIAVVVVLFILVKMTTKRKKNDKLKEEEEFAKVYYDPTQPEAFAGAARLIKKFPKSNKAKIKKWIARQPTYTLHKPMRRKFTTRKYKVPCVNHLWQMDLMEMIPYSRINSGNRYILTCIDVYSRFARAQPVKLKDGKSMVLAIKKMLDKKNTPKSIQTDLGKEFYNKLVQELFAKYKINHYSVQSQFKAAIVERFNRTLRERLNRFFTSQGNKKWLSALPNIINAYNHSSHRTLKGKRPIDLLDNDLNEWKEIHDDDEIRKRRKNTFPVGTLVRISRISNSPFRKNFDQNWSEEIFRITAVDSKESPVMYVLKDMKDEIIQGKFYHEELQDVGDTLPEIYRIEKIIRTKGKGKYKQYLVKWYGYNDSFNKWITADKFV